MSDLWNFSFLPTPPPTTQELGAKTMGTGGGEGCPAQAPRTARPWSESAFSWGFLMYLLHTSPDVSLKENADIVSLYHMLSSGQITALTPCL